MTFTKPYSNLPQKPASIKKILRPSTMSGKSFTRLQIKIQGLKKDPSNRHLNIVYTKQKPFFKSNKI